MQHYGAPTRILDWTRSLFVALYFAVEEYSEKDGAVWAVHLRTVRKWMEKTYKDYRPPGAFDNEAEHYWNDSADERLYVLVPKTLTDRMGAQQTAFSISPNALCDHGQILYNATAEAEGDVFTKILIPAGLKPECLRRLREMNVTARALFPGIDGLGRSAGELTKLRCWRPT